MKKQRKSGWLLVALLLLAGCASGEAAANEKGTETPHGTVTPAVTLSGTVTPASERTETPVPTKEETRTLTPTVTPVPPDQEAPELTLLGDAEMKVIAREEFTDPYALAVDDRDGDITERIRVTGEVNIELCGRYVLDYEVSDSAGNTTTVERTVVVSQPDVIVPEGKIIYLTFDDGPGTYTEKLLELLKKYDITATFFYCGTSKKELITKCFEAGNSIGAHCYKHDYNVVYKDEDAYFEDLNKIRTLIFEATGWNTTLIRFPGGSSNKVSSFSPKIMTRLTEKVEQMGFQYFDWNVSAGDCDTKDTAVILENLKKGVQKKDYSVVLLHSENKSYSFFAVEDFIKWALENGYTFLSLDKTSPRTHHRVAN